MQRDLVARAQDGDHEAFTDLVALGIDRLYATARLILRADDRAQEAVQDGLLQAWLGIRGLRDPDRFEAWSRRLVVHACYRVGKRESARRVIEIQAIAETAATSGDSQSAFAMRDQLERGFRRLPPAQRAVLVVHFYLDLPDADAAEALGVPIGTMKSRLNRATSALRAALEADERRPAYAEEVAR